VKHAPELSVAPGDQARHFGATLRPKPEQDRKQLPANARVRGGPAPLRIALDRAASPTAHSTTGKMSGDPMIWPGTGWIDNWSNIPPDIVKVQSGAYKYSSILRV
jgi:hypothetical protein